MVENVFNRIIRRKMYGNGSRETRGKILNRGEIEHLLGETDALRVDGFDEAILGVCERFGTSPIVAYDVDKCLQILVKGGMSLEEAREYFEFNILGAWVGEGTPTFITRTN